MILRMCDNEFSVSVIVLESEGVSESKVRVVMFTHNSCFCLVNSVAEYFMMYILEKFSYNNTLVLGKITLFCNKFQTCAVWFAPLA